MGRFLGCPVSVKGIKANPDKINAIVNVKPPQSRKEVQRVIGRIITLNRFIAKLAEQSLPFSLYSGALEVFNGGQSSRELLTQSKITYKNCLRWQVRSQISHAHGGKWIPHARKRQMQRRQKAFATSASILCFRSPSWLQEVCYSKMEKICYVVVMSARKLRHYFEAHRVRLLTNQPLNDIFGNRDCSGRIGKWVMELCEHVVDFEKRSAIKLQVQVDFIADWTEPSSYTEGPVINGLVLEGGDETRSKAVHKFTRNRSLSTQRWIENPLEGGTHSCARQT
jgi:hypothetical protein